MGPTLNSVTRTPPALAQISCPALPRFSLRAIVSGLALGALTLVGGCASPPEPAPAVQSWCTGRPLSRSSAPDFLRTLTHYRSLPPHTKNGSPAATGHTPSGRTAARSVARQRLLKVTSSDRATLTVAVFSPARTQALVLIPVDTCADPLLAPATPETEIVPPPGIALTRVELRRCVTPAQQDIQLQRTQMIADLVAVARELQARRLASPKNLFIKGARHHGWIALQTALSRPELFRGVVLQDPILDLEGVIRDESSPLHAAYAALWGTDKETLRTLSPLQNSPDFFPLDILISLSDKRPRSGFLGTLEWIRRTSCEHPELRSLLVNLDNSPPQSSADALLLPHEERFIRSTLLLEW